MLSGTSAISNRWCRLVELSVSMWIREHNPDPDEEVEFRLVDVTRDAASGGADTAVVQNRTRCFEVAH